MALFPVEAALTVAAAAAAAADGDGDGDGDTLNAGADPALTGSASALLPPVPLDAAAGRGLCTEEEAAGLGVMVTFFPEGFRVAVPTGAAVGDGDGLNVTVTLVPVSVPLDGAADAATPPSATGAGACGEGDADDSASAVTSSVLCGASTTAAKDSPFPLAAVFWPHA